jgi:NTP pyrophosphatase (non-canonical NTP hydrolase)
MKMLNELAKSAYENSVAHGFWEGPENENLPTKIALIHSEASELLEALRYGDPPSEHVPEIPSSAEEFADIIIRVGDMAYKMGIDLDDAVTRKMRYNASRPRKHGGKVF